MIRVQNIYYMLAYTFRILREQGYRRVATEQFESAPDLFAAILAQGMRSQLKRGLEREYIDTSEEVSSLRGKIEIAESLKSRAVLDKKMVCSYDEFSENTRMNRILKATCKLLLHSDIDKGRKKELRRLLAYFSKVDDVELGTVDWHIRFARNNQTYRMLMGVCWLVAKGLLQTQADGSSRLVDFLDEQRMSRMYETFILEYYRREHPELTVSASFIEWALDDGFDDMLPVMRSDIMLTRNDAVLIIDAKYYAHTMRERFGARTIHSENLYQIFAYVKNKEAELAGVPHEVSGMLLYAKTDEGTQPNATYLMSGNRISARTLDLDCPFAEVRKQLDGIVEEFFS